MVALEKSFLKFCGFFNPFVVNYTMQLVNQTKYVLNKKSKNSTYDKVNLQVYFVKLAISNKNILFKVKQIIVGLKYGEG